MKAMRACFIFIFISCFFLCNEIYSLGVAGLIPIFYDKTTQKLYGLLTSVPAHAFGLGYVKSTLYPIWFSYKNLTSIVQDMEEAARRIFGESYDKLQLDFSDEYMFDLSERTVPNYFVPVARFIAAQDLNKTARTEINDFQWIDMDDFPNYYNGRQLILNWTHMGDIYPKPKLDAYKRFMETQPAQKVILQAGQPQGARRMPEAIQPEPYQPQIPSQREVLYPKDVRPEDKFYYDAVSNAPSKLLQNIKIAKERGTLNNFIGGAYGVRQTALTKSLIDHGNPIIIKILLENGANSNLADVAGNSPIYWAIFRNRPKETIALLLQHGANPNVKIETQDASGQVSRKPLIDIVQDENVKKLLEYYINNPVKPSIVPTAPIANDVIRTLQQLIFSLRQLQQKINELPQSQKEPEALGKVVGGETPYQILGISPQATPQEIKKAYFKAAQKWHPDKWAKASPAEQEQAGIMFDKIKNAYEELTNPQKISSSVKKGEYTSQAEELVEKILASQEEALGIRIVVLNKYTTPILGDLNLGIQGSLSEFKKAAKKNDQSTMNRTFKVIQEQLTSVNDFMRQVNDYIVKQYPASKTLRSDVFADAFKEFIAVLVKNGLRKKFINKNKAAAMKLAGLFKNFFENNSFFDTDFMQRRYTNKIMKTLNA